MPRIADTIRRLEVIDLPQVQEMAPPADRSEGLPFELDTRVSAAVIRRRGGRVRFRSEMDVPEGTLTVSGFRDAHGTYHWYSHLLIKNHAETRRGNGTREHMRSCRVTKMGDDTDPWFVVGALVPNHTDMDPHRLMPRGSGHRDCPVYYGFEIGAEGVLQLLPLSDPRLVGYYDSMGMRLRLPPRAIPLPETAPPAVAGMAPQAAEPGQPGPPAEPPGPVPEPRPGPGPGIEKPPAPAPLDIRAIIKGIPTGQTVTVHQPVTPWLTLTIEATKGEKEISFHDAICSATFFGREIPLTLTRKVGKDRVDIAFELTFGKTKRDFSIRVERFEAKDGRLCLATARVAELTHQIEQARECEERRVLTLAALETDKTANAIEQIDAGRRCLKGLAVISHDVPAELAALQGEVEALEGELLPSQERVGQTARDYLLARHRLEAEFVRLPEDRRQFAMRLATARDRHRAIQDGLRAERDRVNDLAQRAEADVERYYEPWEVACQDLQRTEAKTAPEIQRLTQDCAGLEREIQVLDSATDGHLDAMAVKLQLLEQAVGDHERLIARIRTRLTGIEERVHARFEETRRSEQRAEDARRLAAQHHGTEKARLEREVFVAERSFVLSRATAKGPGLPYRYTWSVSGGLLFSDFYMTEEDSKTYADVAFTSFVLKGGIQKELGPFQAITDSSARGGGMYFVALPGKGDNVRDRRVLVYWSDPDGIARLSEMRFEQLPGNVRLQLYMNVFTPEEGPGTRTYPLGEGVSVSVGDSTAVMQRAGRDYSLQVFTHPGTRPVTYYYASAGKRWFVERSYAGAMRLCEHVKEGVPLFVRLAQQRSLGLGGALSEVAREPLRTYTAGSRRVTLRSADYDITPDPGSAFSSLGFGRAVRTSNQFMLSDDGEDLPIVIYGYGPNWADNGGYLMMVSPDPAQARTFVEFNSSGGGLNQLLPVSKGDLNFILSQVLPLAAFKIAGLPAVNPAADGKLSRTVVLANSLNPDERITLTGSWQDGATQLSQLGFRALLDVSGQEVELLPFVHGSPGGQVLCLTTPDGKRLFKLENVAGADAFHEYGLEHNITRGLRESWRQALVPERNKAQPAPAIQAAAGLITSALLLIGAIASGQEPSLLPTPWPEPQTVEQIFDGYAATATAPLETPGETPPLETPWEGPQAAVGGLAETYAMELACTDVAGLVPWDGAFSTSMMLPALALPHLI